MNTRKKHSDHDLIDPEPVTLFLTILGAIGSIASLYSFVDNRLLTRRTERQANRNNVRDALMGAETALNDIGAQLRSFELAFEVGSRSPKQYGDALVAFGRVELFFTADGHQTWREIQDGVLVAVGRLQRHLSDVMRIFTSSNVKLPEATARQVQGGD